MFEKGQKVILSDALVARLIQTLPLMREALTYSNNVAELSQIDADGIVFAVGTPSVNLQFYLSSGDAIKHTRQFPDKAVQPDSRHTGEADLHKDENACDCPTCLAERNIKEREVEMQKLHNPRELVIVHHCYNVIDRYLGYRTNNALSSLAKYSQHKSLQQRHDSDPMLQVESGDGYISINLGGEEQKLLDAACQQLRKIIENGPEPVLNTSRPPTEQPVFRVMNIDERFRDKIRTALAEALSNPPRP